MNSYIDKANQSLSQQVPSKKTIAERNNHLVLEQSRIGRQTNNLTMLQEKADSSAKVGQSLQLQAPPLILIPKLKKFSIKKKIKLIFQTILNLESKNYQAFLWTMLKSIKILINPRS